MDNKNNIPVTIKPEQILEGNTPIVVIGPNGSGKTRYGISLAGWNNSDIIAARRNIALQASVTLYSHQQAQNNMRSQINEYRNRPWEISNEIESLFSKLLVEDYSSASEFRNDFYSGQPHEPKITNLMQIQFLWNRLFPGRKISFINNEPKVQNENSTAPVNYSAQQMSDGERVSLYLAGRVLDSTTKIIIVDEPELHFHSKLAMQFWDELEKLRADCRFIYITHDLPFALSRKDADFVVLRKSNEPELISLDDGIPHDLAKSLLAAASFSIHAKRIVFCEGARGKSIDERLYSAWFSETDTTVVSAGKSGDVIMCSKAYSNSRLLTGVSAIGIIDRDYLPDQYINGVGENLFVLPVHEVESLLCLRGVFSAVAKYLSIPNDEIGRKYEEFLGKAKAVFRGSTLNKQISSRFKDRIEYILLGILRGSKVSENIDETKESHLKTLMADSWNVSPDKIFQEEVERMSDALAGDEFLFLREYPGKAFWKSATDVLGISQERYLDIVCEGLAKSNDPKYAVLNSELTESLKDFLPVRVFE